MAVSRETKVRVNLWRILLQSFVLNAAMIVWLVHSIVTHNTDLIWAAALFLVLLGLPQIVGLVMAFRREPIRGAMLGRAGPRPNAEKSELPANDSGPTDRPAAL